MTAAERLVGLADAARTCGVRVEAAANVPLRLDDTGAVWFVARGGLDVFLTEHSDGEAVSSPSHVLRAGPGRLAFGVHSPQSPLAAVAKGLPGSEVYRLSLAELCERAEAAEQAAELVAEADRWVSEFAAAVSRQIALHPRTDVLLGAHDGDVPQSVEAGAAVFARPGCVRWLACDEPADVAFLDTERPPDDGTGMVPLTSVTWARVLKPTVTRSASSADLHREGRLFDAVADFHRLALAAEHFNRLLLLADEANEQSTRASYRRSDADSARRGLFSVLQPAGPAAGTGGSALLDALNVVGHREGIVFRAPARRSGALPDETTLQGILDASGVRARRVRLSAQDRWWLGDSGAMLGFASPDRRPLALLPGRAGRYVATDPATGASQRVSAARAAEIDEEAWCFYAPLPEDRPVGVGDLIRVAGRQVRGDLARFAVAGLLASLLSLVPSMALGMLAGWVLPSGAGGTLAQVVVALVGAAAIGGLLLMLQQSAMSRIEGRATARATAALWDRVLRLPTPFFKGFGAGDLAVRLGAFQLLRDQVSGVVSRAVFSVVFLVPGLALLLVYDAALALVSIAVGVVSLLVAGALGVLQLRPQRRRYAASRRLTADVLQFVNGIGKLRTAGAEVSAIASWARGYREQQLARLRIDRPNAHLVAYSAALPMLAGAALFGAVLQRGADELPVGGFLIVFGISMTFHLAVAGMGRSFEAVAAVLPAMEQVVPVLEAVPESRVADGARVELGGDVRFDRVSFRYSPDGPLILDDVSIHARPGEFIALVGESGAGKSTLLRLALGLEEPATGGVYYDGRELSNLDRRAVRREVGAVVQSGGLRPGDILDNIVGPGNDLTIDDAWRAARLAAVDADIEAMPMGMFTTVNDTSTVFSGGQVQRIRIASALVRGPRVVFLDEATNWLDTASQDRVMTGIEDMAATRIVIAHRLSTIRRAERIYVLEAGRVRQVGSFDELQAADGPFRRLVRRQMT